VGGGRRRCEDLARAQARSAELLQEFGEMQNEGYVDGAERESDATVNDDRCDRWEIGRDCSVEEIDDREGGRGVVPEAGELEKEAGVVLGLRI
jgi:hypothetical protein